MNDEKEKLLKELKVEDIVWSIYLIIIGLSYYSSIIERNYIYTDSEISKNRYRLINMTVFTLVVLVCIYFAYENYKNEKELNEKDTETKKHFTQVEFLASLLALASASLFLYASIYDINIETEIAFN